MLIRLDQKVRGQVRRLLTPPAQLLHHRRRGATFPTLWHRRNVVSPSSPRQDALRGKRTARRAFGAAGKGGGSKRKPACNGSDRSCAGRHHHSTRKGADFPLVFRHEKT